MKNAVYKIIAACTLLASLVGCATVPGNDKPWATLFDKSSNLNGWTQVGQANWRIQEEALQADLLASPAASYLVSKKQYADFEILADFWVDSETNSGIFIRCQDPKKVGADNCYEVNIWDTRPDPSYGTGAIVDVAKVNPMPRAGGRWNTMEITAQGTRLTVKLNGEVTVDTADAKWSKGHVSLQYGSGVVKFRKVVLREL